MEAALEWRQSTSRDRGVGRGRKKAVRRRFMATGYLTRGNCRFCRPGETAIRRSHTSSAPPAALASFCVFLVSIHSPHIRSPLSILYFTNSLNTPAEISVALSIALCPFRSSFAIPTNSPVCYHCRISEYMSPPYPLPMSPETNPVHGGMLLPFSAAER